MNEHIHMYNKPLFKYLVGLDFSKTPPPRHLATADKPPVAELQKVARDEKVSFGMATLHFVGKFESQVYYQTLWYNSYYYTLI